jgi:transcriptional regulator with XRE-family HTH domain
LFAPVMSVVVMLPMLEGVAPAEKRPVEPRTRRATLRTCACAIIEVVTLDHDELAGCLRSWRDRVSPAEAGFAAGRGRRVSGLRREEVAQLAGVSVDYLARLEQGRAGNPSPSVLASLARALRLSHDERAHLFRLAGHAEPRLGTVNRHIGPGVQRLLDRLGDVPVMVVDASWQVVAANLLATALLGDLSSASGRDRNLAWRHFTGAPSRLVRSEEEEAAADAEIVGDLREALGRYPDDEPLKGLVDDLRAGSARFASAWDEHPVARRAASRKTFRHPEIGELTLDCDVLVVQGSDLRLVVYTAASGSTGAEALALLRTIGLQSFSGL